jgi:EmrB/QacA subfamily drug resistance transporter
MTKPLSSSRPAASTSAAPPAVAGRQHALLTIVLVAYLMILIDNSIVFTGVPAIREDLGMSVTSVSWVQTAYALTFGGLLLLGARAGDVLGRRRVFITGLLLFSLASLAVGAAPSGAVLIAARAVQGAGSAVLAPATLGLLTAGFAEGPERNRAVGAYGATAGIGAALGLVLGGFVSDALSWRVGFLINLPIGLALVVASLRCIAVSPTRPGRTGVTGAATSTLGMTALVYGIVRAGESGWADTWSVSSLAAAVVLLAAFVQRQRTAPQPILPLRLFASRQRTGAYLARALFIGGMISYFLFLSQFLQGARGFSALQAGAAFLPMTVVNFATALAAPRLSKMYGTTRVLVLGIAITLVGMAWLSRLTVDGPLLLQVALPLVLIGGGQGLAFAPLTSAGVAGTAPEDAGAASGLVNAAHQLGGALGLGILVTIADAARTGSSATAQLATSTTAALTGSAVLLGLSLLTAIALIGRTARPIPASPSAAASAGASSTATV